MRGKGRHGLVCFGALIFTEILAFNPFESESVYKQTKERAPLGQSPFVNGFPFIN